MIRRRSFVGACAAVSMPALGLFRTLPASAATRPDLLLPQIWNDPREISVHNENTGERGSFCYFADGKWQMEGYLALCSLLRDHREHMAIQLQPACFDLIYITQRWYEMAERRAASTTITSGYRTPRTNRIVGGAPGGQHPKGAALDGRLDGVVLVHLLLIFGGAKAQTGADVAATKDSSSKAVPASIGEMTRLARELRVATLEKELREAKDKKEVASGDMSAVATKPVRVVPKPPGVIAIFGMGGTLRARLASGQDVQAGARVGLWRVTSIDAGGVSFERCDTIRKGARKECEIHFIAPAN